MGISLLRRRLQSSPAISTLSSPFTTPSQIPCSSRLHHRRCPHHLAGTSFGKNTCIPLLKSCSAEAQLQQIHARLITSSLVCDPAVSVTFLSRVALDALPRDMDYARVLFDQLPAPTTAHYNIMIRAHSQTTITSSSTLRHEAFCFYNDMRRNGVRTNPMSVSFLLKSCARVSCLVGGRQLHARVLQDGHQLDSLLMTTLMDMYGTCGRGDEAQSVFDQILMRDTVAWNVLISCYTRNGRTRDALRLFDSMQLPPNPSQPDDVTCLLLLQVCSQLNCLDFGERIHEYIEKHNYGCRLNLRNSLISMYSKCGCVAKAYALFCDTPKKNVVTWSAVISGLAMNGYGRDALDAFRQMRRIGVAPDEQTFTGVLSACSHCGLVEEGLQLFELMRTEYNMSPTIHHYGCVVDLLGRAGKLEDAYGLIVNSMDVKPDPTIWRTILGACRIHRHFSLGERVIEHLIELKAQEAGDFVLLLNLYASAGDWNKVADLRRLMKDNAIQTSPGCSTIELHGQIHEFVANDASHKRRAEIYIMLDEIEKQLKIAGYIANLNGDLHASDLGGKQSALSYHSEKLAIAFGVLATPPGTTIRIAKNLRTCVDCHVFTKFLSSVYNRVVIIRDRSRFHHFKEGNCSCNDYW